MTTSDTEKSRFVMEHISRSEKARDIYVPIWAEVLQNYLVRPSVDSASTSDTSRPYYDTVTGGRTAGESIRVLKDPETRQVIDTLLAKLMIALFPNDDYIQAKKRGREDARAARTVSRLLNYVFSLEGHYRVVQTTLLDMLLFGTGVMRASWSYIERPRRVRDIVVEGGEEFVVSKRFSNYPIYDDVAITNVDVMDFYPDPGHDQLKDMLGVAQRFTVTGNKAMKMASTGQYSMQLVKQAIAKAMAKDDAKSVRKGWRVERPPIQSSHPAFKSLEGYEYFGEVPWSNPDGENWRVITLLDGVVVRDIPWPLDIYRVPFYDFTLSPIQGRFYGLSPAEGARYQQDFIDFLLMMIADSVVRAVHPPLIHHSEDDMDRRQLASWRPDVPIASDHPNEIRTLPYSANLQGGFGLFQSIKQSIRENTGALGSTQGLGLGINRASATEAARTFENALNRPELGARYIERECLPALGKGIFSLYQENLEDTEDLMERVGELPDPIFLSDISGDYDIQFIGSRLAKSEQVRMANLDRLIQMAQVPQIGNLIDWKDLAIQILEGLGFDVLAENIAAPMTVAQNLLIQQLAGPQQQLGNGNAEIQNIAQPNTSLEQQAGSLIPQG